MNRTLFANTWLTAALFAGIAAGQNVSRLDIRHDEPKLIRDQLQLGGKNPQGDSIAFNNLYMEQNGVPVVPLMGEFHYVRTPNAEWDQSLKKIKASGVGIVSTYVFWNVHEETEGKFDWSGDKDLHHFIDLCQQNGLKVIVRVGPFCHGEMRNGGLPDWLYGRPFNVRSNDPPYLNCVAHFYNEIGKQLAGQLFKDGGPIIGFQIENEYHHSGAPWAFSYPGQPPEWTVADEKRYSVPNAANGSKDEDAFGSDGHKHMANLLALAHKAGLEPPLYTATGWGNATNCRSSDHSGHFRIPISNLGPYCPIAAISVSRFAQAARLLSGFLSARKLPVVRSRTWRRHHDHIQPSPHSLDTCCRVACRSRIGKRRQRHWLLHVPRRRHAARPCVLFERGTVGSAKISYDFQAPIGQYGRLASSYDNLKLIHYFLNDFGSLLAPMTTVLPDSAAKMSPTDVDQLRFAVRSHDDSGFVFLHNFQDHVATHDLVDQQIVLQTKGGELRIPNDSTFTVKSETATFFPFNLDLSGLRLRYATAQPMAKLNGDSGPHYAFVAVDGIEPEFAFDSTAAKQIQSKDCHVATANSLSIVRCSANAVSQFIVENDRGQPITFVIFPKSWPCMLGAFDTNHGTV